MEEAKCQVCSKPSKLKCGGCQAVFYCTKEHQQSAWQEHKKDCRPFKVGRDEHARRCLISRRAFNEGDLIFQELPLVFGPRLDTHPVCLGCLNMFNMAKSFPCKMCRMPLCSEDCQDNPNHIPECFYLLRAGGLRRLLVSFQPSSLFYNCILILRCLYQKLSAPDVWKKINRLQQRYGEIKKNEAYKDVRQKLVNVFHKSLDLEDDFSAKEIEQIWQIISINKIEVPTAKPPAEALYEFASMIEHSCKANCHQTVSPDGRLRVIAGQPIAPGDHLSVCNTYGLWTTILRQRHLLQNKFFACSCSRCADPTEFGTNFSALKCQNPNCDGLMLPETFLVDGLSWICNKCPMDIPVASVERIFDRIYKKSNVLKVLTTGEYYNVLKYQQEALPDNHSCIINLKVLFLMNIEVSFEAKVESIPGFELKLKVDVCRQILEVFKNIAPAELKYRTDTEIRLYVLLQEVCRRKQHRETFVNSQDCADILEERRRLLTTILRYLKHTSSYNLVVEDCLKELEKLNVK